MKVYSVIVELYVKAYNKEQVYKHCATDPDFIEKHCIIEELSEDDMVVLEEDYDLDLTVKED